MIFFLLSWTICNYRAYQRCRMSKRPLCNVTKSPVVVVVQEKLTGAVKFDYR
jgi:hypothetical protein